VSGGSLLASFHWSPNSILSQSMWGLWWIKWHRHRFIYENMGIPVPVTFHHCSTCIFKFYHGL
jgi:hypothetical protein